MREESKLYTRISRSNSAKWLVRFSALVAFQRASSSAEALQNLILSLWRLEKSDMNFRPGRPSINGIAFWRSAENELTINWTASATSVRFKGKPQREYERTR